MNIYIAFEFGMMILNEKLKIAKKNCDVIALVKNLLLSELNYRPTTVQQVNITIKERTRNLKETTTYTPSLQRPCGRGVIGFLCYGLVCTADNNSL